MAKKIKLFDPVIGKQERNNINKVLDSRYWASGSGTGNVSIFEKKFQRYIKSQQCIAVNSGTAALHLALSLANIKGKEVILPSLSFISTAHSVVYNGGKLVFVDIEPDTLCINPEQVEKNLSDKTKVILPVHFGGFPSDLFRLNKISKNAKCMLIEDAAHACGSEFQGKKIGNHSDIVCFSFHPVKNLAMPTGGLISINHKNHKKMKKILFARRWCGITDRRTNEYDIKEIGWNFYMNEFSAAIGLAQLEKLDKLNKIRKKTAKKYYKKINLDQKMLFSNNCVYHFYWICVKNRTQFRKIMKEMGIETGTHYKPIHKMSMYKSKVKLPVTERIAQNIVTLPTHPNLDEKDVDRIISLVNKFAK